MAGRLRSSGWSARPTGTREWLRIRYRGYHVHDVPTVAELARYIPLVKLEEALTRPQIQADVLIPAQRAVA
jgi:hypothetical protein